ncbi:hypothetical protein [Eoetvoesiella caeni]|uniref:Uncharacterized protein n=1 Tax=Eoetvoesiella caeni TaxID=645616 RepID=A0A366GYA3_9BURK|nr:hypothetical protein [Eoetvoesiella caeni]MCI2811348.1 hypothetical protein [Eoetvoesiella caeni]NYT57233.1 hypothetical protein [Eoetvoesiella caeni]RBP33580.1 hypothetical protein DFR37_1297 [Eoetvoesiella caeni]
MGWPDAYVRTRFYSEEKLKKLPLLHLPEAEKISAAQTAIRTNPIYLGSITPRTPPLIPAHHAAEFTFGRCAAYAEALSEVSGFEPVALLATRFHAAYGGAKSALGDYVHSFVMHPDGRAEDAWGITTIHEIAVRFGVAEFKVSASDHKIVVNNLTQNSPEQYVEAFDLAKSLLFTHRAQTNINP